MPHKVFLTVILSKTSWYRFENSKTIKNKIIDPIWKAKIWCYGAN